MKAVREPHVARYITPAFVGRGGESCTHRSRSVPEGIAAYETAEPKSALSPLYPRRESNSQDSSFKPDTSANCITGASLVGAVGVEPTSA